ncbi:4'-phosphopantetheinyl transferase superfamily protein [Streptomyces tauricus]|uniref:4'-phosphopantetheinyl transferase superfamily protein n=1 Tax=Streptomyces tauricus TaxID=68274 RepID=A0ABZ1JWS8_9ACTN|nr:4'-phosphopantetheinyl transferase superfamily protein [Streptomyces tauricus]MCW8096131.1 4'-phosphopantetheinyl transferase superfamily protein [Streptomyces tauricus]
MTITSPDRVAARSLDDSMALDPARPLYVSHARGPLTVAVVSIAWLRGRDETDRATIGARHLSDDEIRQAAQLRLIKRRLEWLAGRLAIKHSVCAYQRRHAGVSVHPRDITVGVVPDGLRAGKPVVDARVEVGLSHSVDFAVAVCGPRAVGIDVERSRQVPPPLADLLTHPPEIAADPRLGGVGAMPLPLRWACKEAVLKHFGFGLRVDSREVRLTQWWPDGRFAWRAGPELRRHAPAADGSRFDSWAREVDGYALALVWQ